MKPVWINHPTFDAPVLTSNPEIAARYPRLTVAQAHKIRSGAVQREQVTRIMAAFDLSDAEWDSIPAEVQAKIIAREFSTEDA